MSPVLLTYGWVRSSYAALRNLSDHGVHVYVADSKRIGMSQWSNRKCGFDLYPSHYADEEEFVKRIVEICGKRKIGLILPSHNETEVLARHHAELPDGVGALLPNSQHTEVFNNKARAYDYAESIGVSVPVRVLYDDPTKLSAQIESVGIKKTVIKLLTGNSAKGVFYADSPSAAQVVVQELISEYQLESSRYPQVEERVNGEGWGCSVLYWNGQLITHFTHRRLREKITTGGTSTLREAATHVAIEDAARRIFDHIGWHGLAMCEFKVCPDTGKYWFIEVNPRLWGSIPLAISSGREFPYLAWLCATEGVDAALNYQANCILRQPWKSRWLLGDLTVAAKEVLSGKLRQAAGTVFGANADYTDDVFWDDPFVFPGEIAVYMSSVISNRSLNPSEKGMVG